MFHMSRSVQIGCREARREARREPAVVRSARRQAGMPAASFPASHWNVDANVRDVVACEQVVTVAQHVRKLATDPGDRATMSDLLVGLHVDLPTPTPGAASVANPRRWCLADRSPARIRHIPKLEEHLAACDGQEGEIAVDVTLVVSAMAEGLATDHGVAVGDQWYVPAALAEELPPLYDERLEALKERVGIVRMQIGVDGWRNAVNYVDRFSGLGRLHRAPSRSYFKLVEMARALTVAPARALHLCEAPGGFVAATQDMWACVSTFHSLEAPGSIPFKTLHGRVAAATELPHNANLLVPEVGDALAREGRVYDLVTADGSADNDESPQHAETGNFVLFCREAAVALRVLRPGGALVLKVFDAAHARTHRLLHALACAFEHVRLVKPLTSRATNGELYVLARGFRVDGLSEGLMCSLARDEQPLADVVLTAEWHAAMVCAHACFSSAQLQALRGLFNFLERDEAPPPDASEALWRQIRPPFAYTPRAVSKKRPGP